MREKILSKMLIFIMLIVVLVILTGCSLTGSLNDREYNAIIDTLINEKIIDNISNEETIGAGEMEYIKYTFDATSKNIQYKATLVQGKSLENFRIFVLYLKNENNEGEYIEYYIKVDKKDKIKIYDEWQKEWES